MSYQYDQYLTNHKANVLYLCDRRACEHCSTECQHTTDILHAKNFEIGIDRVTMVEQLNDKEDSYEPSL